MTVCKCDKINSGMLKEPVSIERPTNTTDNAGGYTQTWGAISGAPTLAYAKAVSGNERWASDRVEATVRLRVAVRYFAGILPSDTVVIRSRRCNIRFVNNVEFADRWLEIDLDEGVAV